MTADGILGIDTATADSAVAVTLAGELVCERRAGPGPDGRPRHAEAVLVEVEAAVSAAGGWPRIGLIGIGIGPGTFTGLRIGIATALALAQARGLEVAPVSSLEALARGIGETAPGRPRLALLDARRRELFAALFGAAGEPVWAPEVLGPDQLGERVASLADSPAAGGDGSLRFRSQLESAGVEVLPDGDAAHRLAARHICGLAAVTGPRAASDVRPAYLRRPDAEVWREQRNRDPGPG